MPDPASPFRRAVMAAIDTARYEESQRALHARLVQSRGRESVEDEQGRLRAAYALMILDPGLGEQLESLGARLRLSSAVPPDLRELAILGVAAGVGSRTQWDIHLPIARAAGVTANELYGEPGGEPALATMGRRAVWRAVSAWLAGLPGDRHDRQLLMDELGPAGLCELVAVVGYYRMLAMQLAVFDLEER